MIMSYDDTIMAVTVALNLVKTYRQQRGWSQAELATRAGISRTAVSAVEIQRLVPSVAAALSLAAAFGCAVEDLFGLARPGQAVSEWAWPPASTPCRFWLARVGERVLRFPVETPASGGVAHDGVSGEGSFAVGNVDPAQTLVLASCDPAVNLLAAEYAKATGFRLLALRRSSRQGITLLGQGLVHVAGVHFATDREPDGNVRTVRDTLGTAYDLIRVAHWQEGLSIAPDARVRSVSGAVRARLRWVGREPGSAARQCLDALLEGRPAPRRMALDHHGVADAIRCGWADVGVCHRLVCEEAGLRFLAVRREHFDLCYPAASKRDPRIQALLGVLRSPAYRGLLADLPGYDMDRAGEEACLL